MQPHEYPRRILLCVSGNSPQIITETLYALAVETDGRPPFVPTEIRVLTTSCGAENTRRSLLEGDRAKLRELCQDHGLSGIHFDETCIEVFKRTDGSPLADIITPEDNRDAADHITRLVAELTGDSESAIHASIAGGRKTMGFYLGYAMSLFGREQDRVSHVLVSKDFTDRRDFFFKPKSPVTLLNEQGEQMSTADARIHLAEIPMVRLRSTEFGVVSDRKMGFADAVERANLFSGKTEFRLKVDRKDDPVAGRGVVKLNGIDLKLSPSGVAFVHWLARRRKAEAKQGGEGWVARKAFEYGRNSTMNRGYLNEILTMVSDVYGEESVVTENVRNSILPDKDGNEPVAVEWLKDVVGGINRRIKASFGEIGVSRYGIVTTGKRELIPREKQTSFPKRGKKGVAGRQLKENLPDAAKEQPPREEYKYRLAIDPEYIHLEE